MAYKQVNDYCRDNKNIPACWKDFLTLRKGVLFSIGKQMYNKFNVFKTIVTYAHGMGRLLVMTTNGVYSYSNADPNTITYYVLLLDNPNQFKVLKVLKQNLIIHSEKFEQTFAILSKMWRPYQEWKFNDICELPELCMVQSKKRTITALYESIPGIVDQS
jgi:hypothetical protein